MTAGRMGLRDHTKEVTVEFIKQFGWLPTLILLVVATIVAGIILKVTAPNKKPSKRELEKLSDREKWEKYRIGEGPQPGDDVEEYWRDYELLKQGGGRDDEYFRDDQI
jgi:hypothetical protein